MRYRALATDYDGTLAAAGRVDARAAAALDRLRASGRRLLLVTGRIRADLEAVFPRARLFDAVVAENGATLWRPGEAERLLAPPPPGAFVDLLRARGVPIEVGKVVVATRAPHDAEVLRAIRELGLDLEIVFNKGAVMVLPPGVTKASGLEVAVASLGLTRHEVVAVGDAENDLAMLTASECGAAVDNALPAVKAAADLVTRGARGDGVIELAGRLVRDDLADVDPPRHRVELGATSRGRVTLSPAGTRTLVLGEPADARAALMTGAARRLAARGYQVLLLDPEGALGAPPGFTPLGTARRAPEIDEIAALLARTRAAVAVNLRAVRQADRARFMEALWPAVRAVRAPTARPHWVALDEARPALALAPALATFAASGGLLLGTPRPDRLPAEILARFDAAVATGADAPETLRALAAALRSPPPLAAPGRDGEALLWRPGEPAIPFVPSPPEGQGLEAPAAVWTGAEPNGPPQV